MKRDFDWLRIERIMRASITGHTPNDEESKLLRTAWRRAPEQYRELHKRVQAEERAKVNLFGG